MPGDALDLILIALAAAFAVAGYRQGFVIGVLSFVGFLGGAAVGAAISPRVASLVHGPTQQGLLAIVVVFVAAVAGQLIASMIGAALRSRLTWRPVAFVDSIGGAAVSVLSVLLIAWLIGSAVANAPMPGVSQQVHGSVVLRAVDRLMPPAAHVMFSNFRRLFTNGPYPQVFGALGAGGALNVPAPDPRVLDAPGLARDKPSIVKIVGVAPECERRLEGSGFVIAPEHVLTNAHVVAGVTADLVVVAGQQGTLVAHVVLYDPLRDVAILYVPGLSAPVLHFAGSAASGSDAIVAGYPQNHRFTAVPARVASEETATAPDIYQTRYVSREIYSVRALVRPGNSGGPLLAPDGRVYGVVFAAASNVKDTGYALAARVVSPDATRGAHAVTTVGTQACTAGG